MLLKDLAKLLKFLKTVFFHIFILNFNKTAGNGGGRGHRPFQDQDLRKDVSSYGKGEENFRTTKNFVK